MRYSKELQQFYKSEIINKPDLAIFITDAVL